MNYFITRFGEKTNLDKPKNKKLHFDLGQIVFSQSKGICMIQGYGVYDNQYWIETGIWHQSDYVTDITTCIKGKEKKRFVNNYLKLFKEYLYHYFSNSKCKSYKFAYFLAIAKHYIFIKNKFKKEK